MFYIYLYWFIISLVFVGVFHYFWEILSHYYVKHFLCSLLSSPYRIQWHLYYILYLLMLFYSSWMFCSIFIFLHYFSLCTLFWEVSVDVCSSSLIFSSAMSSLLMNPSMAFLFSVTVFLMPSFSFRFFLRLYISLVILLPVLALLPTFSLGPLTF